MAIDMKFRPIKNSETRQILTSQGNERLNPAQQSTGNRIKFKLEFMVMLLMSDRQKEAAAMYYKIIAELDKLA